MNTPPPPPVPVLTEEELLLDAVSLQQLQYGDGPGDGRQSAPHPGRVLRHERLREERPPVIRVRLAAEDGARPPQQLLVRRHGRVRSLQPCRRSGQHGTARHTTRRTSGDNWVQDNKAS